MAITQSPGGGSTPLVTGMLAGAGALVAVVGLFGAWRASSVIVTVVGAWFLAIGLERPVLALTRRGLRRPLAVAVVAAVAVLLAAGVLVFIVPPLVRQVSEFFAAVPDLARRLAAEPAVADLAARTDLEAKLTAAATPANAARVVTGLVGVIGTVVGFAFALVTTVILAFFVLAGLDRVRAGTYSLVASSHRDRVRLLAQAAQDKVGQYLVGAVLIAAIAGTAALLWTSITGVAYPAVMALVVAVCDLIPQIGATLGSTIVTLVALTSSIELALATVAFFCCYQGLENWVIYPRVMSKAVEISALAALVSAMLGWAVFGVLGVLLAVPVFAAIQMVVREVVLTRQATR